MSVASGSGRPNCGCVLEPASSPGLPTGCPGTSALVLLGESGCRPPTGCARGAVGWRRRRTPTHRGPHGALRPSPLLVALLCLHRPGSDPEKVARSSPVLGWRREGLWGLRIATVHDSPADRLAGSGPAKGHASGADRGSRKVTPELRLPMWQPLGQCERTGIHLSTASPGQQKDRVNADHAERAMMYRLIGYQHLVQRLMEVTESTHWEFRYRCNNRIQPGLRLVRTETLGNQTHKRCPTGPWLHCASLKPAPIQSRTRPENQLLSTLATNPLSSSAEWTADWRPCPPVGRCSGMPVESPDSASNTYAAPVPRPSERSPCHTRAHHPDHAPNPPVPPSISPVTGLLRPPFTGRGTMSPSRPPHTPPLWSDPPMQECCWIGQIR